MKYTDLYGADQRGTTLCVDHERLCRAYDASYIALCANLEGEIRARFIRALDKAFQRELGALLDHARAQGDAYLVPKKDYKLIA